MFLSKLSLEDFHRLLLNALSPVRYPKVTCYSPADSRNLTGVCESPCIDVMMRWAPFYGWGPKTCPKHGSTGSRQAGPPWKGTVASQTSQTPSLALWLCQQRFCSDPNPGHNLLSHPRTGWSWTEPSRNVSQEKPSLCINCLSQVCFPSGGSRSVPLPRKEI